VYLVALLEEEEAFHPDTGVWYERGIEEMIVLAPAAELSPPAELATAHDEAPT